MKKTALLVLLMIVVMSLSVFVHAESPIGSIIDNSLIYKTGSYYYEAPAEWNVNELSGTRHHTLGDSVFYSVSHITSLSGGDFEDNHAAIDDMALNIIKNPVWSAVDLNCGQTGYMAIGESSVTEGRTIYALYIMDSPGFLQVVYSNLNTGSMEKEFKLLISTFSLAGQEVKEDPSDHKYISEGDVGYPIEKLLLRIGYMDIPYTNSKDPEPYMDEAAQAALIHFQDNSGLMATGIFDPDTICLVTGCSVDNSNDLVWIPMHGGRKYHKYEGCSKMIEPREVPAECAIVLDFGPCGRCY